MCADQKQKTDDFIVLLILAYFKETQTKYSISDIAEELGCSLMQASDYIEELINMGFLRFEEYMLRLTLSGREYLANSDMEYYSFDSDISAIYEAKKMDENQVYCVHEFSKRRWRGSNR